MQDIGNIIVLGLKLYTFCLALKSNCRFPGRRGAVDVGKRGVNSFSLCLSLDWYPSLPSAALIPTLKKEQVLSQESNLVKATPFKIDNVLTNNINLWDEFIHILFINTEFHCHIQVYLSHLQLFQHLWEESDFTFSPHKYSAEECT